MSRDKKETGPGHIPKVRLAFPSRRPIQLRYFCPEQGKEIRISTGTYDETEASRQKLELEAKLVLGLNTQRQEQIEYGPAMAWEHFREEFRSLHLSLLRSRSAETAENRLDVCARILKPKTIGDIFETHAMQRLQAKLASGECSRREKPRSPHTVHAYMTNVLAAANWAYDQGWLNERVRFKKKRLSKQKSMKGRPLTKKEFTKFMASVEPVVGKPAKASWIYLIRGLWHSGLRLEEIMNVSWDLPGTITPEWQDGQLPVLRIPAAMQKNDTEEVIPLLPPFERLLQETPPAERVGYVFSPQSLQNATGDSTGCSRFDSEWVGKIISRIGKKSGVVVKPANEYTGAPVKYASAHDLRRSCGQRMLEAGVPPLVISRILRHSSWETTKNYYVPGNVQKDAAVLRDVFAKKTHD